jgi:hypothetical protein
MDGRVLIASEEESDSNWTVEKILSDDFFIWATFGKWIVFM